jgi:hypothetical protein
VLLPDAADLSHYTAGGNGLSHRQRCGREPHICRTLHTCSLLRKITLAWRPFIEQMTEAG